MKDHLQNIETRIRELPRSQRPEKWSGKNYVGGGRSKLEYLDVTVPQLRHLYKSKLRTDSDFNLEVWNHIWNTSNIFEVMCLPLFYFETLSDEELHRNFKTIIQWMSRIDNWAHSDSLSGIYARLLESQPQRMLPILKKWSVSKNPWARRQSLVSLLFYSRARKKVPTFKTIISFVKMHLNDSDYYVQKGVGWTLRECGNVYPRETLQFLQNNVGSISAVAWVAAVEKLPITQKKRLKALRQNSKNQRAKVVK